MLVTIDVPPTARALRALLGGLVALDRVILRDQELPPLYESGIRYQPEPPGQERWCRVDEIWRRKYGDCEDLVGARVAELQLRGEAAFQDVKKSGFRRFHALVRRGDGTLEDPSLRLGMRGG